MKRKSSVVFCSLSLLLFLPRAQAQTATTRACTDAEVAAGKAGSAAAPSACTVVLSAPARRAAPAAPPRRAAAANVCTPDCRPGFFCVNGSCVSPCNPGCDSGEVCAATGECIDRTPAPVATVVALPPAPAPPAPTSFDASSGLGLGLRMSLAGEVVGTDAGTSSIDNLESAYGVSPFVDVAIGPRVTLGVGVSLTFNVRPTAERASARKLDFLGRIAGVVPLSERVRLFGRFTPGYSRILLLRSEAGAAQNPYGFVLAFEAGADYAVGSGAFVTGGLAYDNAFHSQRLSFRSRDSQTRYLQLFVGLGLTL